MCESMVRFLTALQYDLPHEELINLRFLFILFACCVIMLVGYLKFHYNYISSIIWFLFYQSVCSIINHNIVDKPMVILFLIHLIINILRRKSIVRFHNTYVVYFTNSHLLGTITKKRNE